MRRLDEGGMLWVRAQLTLGKLGSLSELLSLH